MTGFREIFPFPMLGLALLLSSCATFPGKGGEGSVPAVIRGDYTLSGTVHIIGTVKVMQGATLTVAPGARLLFEPHDPDKDGVNDSALVVEGGFVARGEPDAPIVFTSAAEKPEPGDWLEIRVEKAEGVVLQYCVVEYARNGLHAHFCSGVIADSIFRHNIDASHFSAGRFLIWNSRFEENLGAGITFRDSALSIERNRFLGNRSGIFLFEKDGGSGAVGNFFNGNTLADVRFGDFFSGDTNHIEPFVGNEGNPVKTLLPDGTERTGVKSPLAVSWEPAATLQRVDLSSLWTAEVGSFLDAAPAWVRMERDGGSDERVAVLAWGGDLIQFDFASGKEVMRTRVGEVADASPFFDGKFLIFPAWDRKVRAVDVRTGKTAWEWEWPPSPNDDHRQASPVPVRPPAGEAQVIQGLWSGELVSLDFETGVLLWRTALDGAVRSTGVQVSDKEFWVVTDTGTLYRISPAGQVIGRQNLVSGGRAQLVREYMFVGGQRVVAVADWNGSVSLMDPQGSVVWSRRVASQGTYAPPVSTRGSDREPFILAGNGDGKVVALGGQKGTVFWENRLRSPVHVIGLLNNRIIFAGTEDGRAVLLDAKTGRTLGEVKTGGAIHGAPLYDPNSRTLVFGSRDGILRAYMVEVTETPWEGPK